MLGTEYALPTRRAAQEASLFFDGKFCGVVGVHFLPCSLLFFYQSQEIELSPT